MDSNLFTLTNAEKGTLEFKTIEFMPTILIGLGGTGKEVLLRTRRQFVEKYGSLKEFPVVSYLYIDTDNAPTEESGTAREKDLLINDIEFQPNEKVFNPVTPSEYIHRINDLPHIKKWLNTEGEIGKLGTMNTGAGQIRPAARLSFFHNYDDITAKLISAKSRITDSISINTVKEKHKIKNVNTDKINIYVITSVSGGTGSGIFLDIGFLIRYLFRNQAISSCYVLMPKIFQGYGKERIFANGYAAFMELEKYNFKNTFTTEWKKNETHTFQPGVFDDVYLIDGENTKNLTLSDVSNKDIYKMVSDTIFQDFANSDFANYKRGVRVNLLQYKQRFWPETETTFNNLYSRKYSSLGQATIAIPVDRIILSCSNKLCEDIINYYLSFAEGSQSDIDSYLINDFLPELGILENKSKSQVLDTLYLAGEKSSIISRIKSFITGLKSELISGKRGNMWSSHLISEIKKFDANFKNDPDISRQGLYYSQIHTNRTKLVKEIIGDRDSGKSGELEKKVIGLINDSTRGVFYSINLLRRLQFIISNSNFDYIPRFEKEINELQGRIIKYEAELKSRLQDLKEDESRSKLNILKKQAMEGSLEKYLSILEKYYESLIKLRARFYAKDICNRILNLIEKASKTDSGRISFSGLITDINKLTGNLGILRDNFKEKYLYFAQKQESSFNLILYQPEDILNEYYPKYIGTGQTAFDSIKELSYKLLKELGASDITDIVNILKDSDAKNVEEKMILFAKRYFEGLRNDIDITTVLFEKDLIRSESKLMSMLNQAHPWLKINEIPGRFKLDDSAKKFYIGVKTNSQSFKKLQTVIQSVLGANAEFKDSADGATITFYSEWAGFPLFYSYCISEEMKYFYDSLQKNYFIDLHTTKHSYIFDDIIPLNTEEQQRLEDTFKALIMGVIFNIFEFTNDIDEQTGKERIIYKIIRSEGITVTKTEQLGIEERLIKQLFSEKGINTLREEIIKKAETAEKRFIEEGKLAELLVIYEYYYERVYETIKKELSGEVKLNIDTYEHKIVRELSKNIERKIIKEGKDNYLNKIHYLKENPDSFSFRINKTDLKRVLILKDLMNKKEKVPGKNIDVSKLKELKSAFEQGLITEEEFKIAKKRFLEN
jgi:hypothetical protein